MPNFLKENEPVTVAFDGYDFGDRLLEGVSFLAAVVQTKGKVTVTGVAVAPDGEAYLSTLNRSMWLKRAKAYAKGDLDIILGDAGYDIPTGSAPSRPEPIALRALTIHDVLGQMAAMADAPLAGCSGATKLPVSPATGKAPRRR